MSLFAVGGPWSARERLPTITENGRSREVLRTKTNADGTFEFTPSVPTADWVTLSANPSDYFAVADRSFGPAGGRNLPRLVEGDNDVGDIALANCGAITGMVRSTDGAPLAGAVVSARRGPGGMGFSSTPADASGRFVVGHLSPGTLTFDVGKEGWITAKETPVEVRVGRTTRVDDITLARASEISGIVVDQDGQPAANVRIWGWPQESGQGAGATTRDDGTFTVYLPQTEPYSFEINRAKEYEPWGGKRGASEFTFQPGTKNVRIVLTRAALLTFRVVDAETRAPVESYAIALDEKLPAGVNRQRFVRGFDVEQRAGGVTTLPASVAKHDVAVAASGYAPFEGAIVLDVGSTDTVTIALARGSTLRGRCVRAGVPVLGASVTLQRETLNADGTPFELLGASGSHLRSDVGGVAGRSRSVVTSADGSFRFGELVPGTYALIVQGDRIAKKTWRGLVVSKRDGLDVGDLVLTSEAIVRGRLITAIGTSAIGYNVSLGSRAERTLTLGREDGSFEFRSLPPGTYEMTWQRPDEGGYTPNIRSARSMDISVVEGEVRDVTIDTTPFALSTVRVRVLRAGEPAVGVMIRGELYVRGDSTGRTYTQSLPVDAEGWARFEIDGTSHFDVAVLGGEFGPPITYLSNLDAVAGATAEHTIEIHSGSLTLQLPESMSTPQPGWSLRAVLVASGRPTLSAYARVPTASRAPFVVHEWKGSVVDLGEFPTGTYATTLHFEHPDTSESDSRRRRMVPLRDPHQTTITIEDGGTARIVVP